MSIPYRGAVWTIHDALQVSLEQETLVTLIKKNIMQQV